MSDGMTVRTERHEILYRVYFISATHSCEFANVMNMNETVELGTVGAPGVEAADNAARPVVPNAFCPGAGVALVRVYIDPSNSPLRIAAASHDFRHLSNRARTRDGCPLGLQALSDSVRDHDA
jgi:hypothetical protein